MSLLTIQSSCSKRSYHQASFWTVTCPATAYFSGREKKEQIERKKEKEESSIFGFGAYYTTTFNIIVTLEDVKFLLKMKYQNGGVLKQKAMDEYPDICRRMTDE